MNWFEDEEQEKAAEEENAEEVGGVIHCFTYDYEFASKVLALNFYISFSGIVTLPLISTIDSLGMCFVQSDMF